MKNEVTQKLNSTLDFIRKNYWPVFIISVPILIVNEIVNLILYNLFLDNENILFLLTFLFGLLLNGLLGVTLIFIIYNIHFKKSFTKSEISHFILKNIIYVSVCLFVINFVTRIGIILLIVPGIYLASRLAMTPYFLCLDNVKLIQSFNLSWEYSKKDFWVIFICISIIAIPAIFLLFIQVFIESQIIISIISILISINVIIGYILIFYFYLDIRSYLNRVYSNSDKNE